MLIKEKIKNLIVEAFSKAINDKKISEVNLNKIQIEVPKDTKNGDFSTPFALEAAKILRKPPQTIAEIVKDYIEIDGLIGKVVIAKPGYINLFLAVNFLSDNLKNILEQNESYGHSSSQNQQKINIEFVSANPTGPLNVVSARAAALGDTIANLLEAIGHQVDREFYVNDHGNQVTLLGKSVWARIKELRGEKIIFPEDGYQGDYIIDIAKHLEKTYLHEINQIKDQDELVNYLSQKAIQYNLAKQKKDLENFKVSFANWFRETSLHNDGKVLEALSFLEKKGVVYTKDDKKLFQSTNYGDDKDRVLLRDDGRPTYLLADIAYHQNKVERGYDQIIDIWGPDHHGYIKRLQGAMETLGCASDKFKILIAQQVNLVKKGEIVKMSKRLGKFSTMQDLLEEIGPDVARYFFIMRSLESHLDFDLDLAKKESSENPVFYLQYAHARICSIFREATKNKIAYQTDKIDSNSLNKEEALILMKLLLLFPEEVQDAAQTMEPHRIASYLLKLAQAFHKFYSEHRILSSDHTKTNSFLNLTAATKIVLRNGLTLLGISSPEKM